MKRTEHKVSLVGWGEEQVVLHMINGNPGVTVFRNNKLTLFGMTPWLRGRIAVLPPNANYNHGTPPHPEHVDLVINMRLHAVNDAVSALLSKDINLLAEAVSTTYMAQQYMGGELLPHLGEIGKRFSSKWGVYVFRDPEAMNPLLKTYSLI